MFAPSAPQCALAQCDGAPHAAPVAKPLGPSMHWPERPHTLPPAHEPSLTDLSWKQSSFAESTLVIAALLLLLLLLLLFEGPL